MFAHIDKRQIMPSFSGIGTLRGDIVLGGGVLPTLSVGGMFNGGENGIGAGASATVNLGGAVLPKVTAGGGAYGKISQNVLGGGVSGTFVEGGWLGGIVPPANGGASLGGQFGVKYSSGLHVLAGNNGAGWGTVTYGGFLIPASTVAVNVGGNRGVLIDNTMFVPPTPTPAPAP
ncbi:hypothetical protein GGF37_007343 [Kickxella alabastrina]|nr:hypothetical protein GGF37_007343 [Kickxella alabastrina]